MESYSQHLNKTGSGHWNLSREFSNLWCPVIPDTCSWEDGPRKRIVHVNNLLDWSWVQKLHFRYKDSMNYLSTWITPNEKHWFPKTFPNVNHSFCGNHNHYPSQHTISTSITNVPLKLPQSFKIPLVGCIQCSSHLDFFILEKKIVWQGWTFVYVRYALYG